MDAAKDQPSKLAVLCLAAGSSAAVWDHVAAISTAAAAQGCGDRDRAVRKVEQRRITRALGTARVALKTAASTLAGELFPHRRSGVEDGHGHNTPSLTTVALLDACSSTQQHLSTATLTTAAVGGDGGGGGSNPDDDEGPLAVLFAECLAAVGPAVGALPPDILASCKKLKLPDNIDTLCRLASAFPGMAAALQPDFKLLVASAGWSRLATVGAGIPSWRMPLLSALSAYVGSVPDADSILAAFEGRRCWQRSFASTLVEWNVAITADPRFAPLVAAMEDETLASLMEEGAFQAAEEYADGCRPALQASLAANGGYRQYCAGGGGGGGKDSSRPILAAGEEQAAVWAMRPSSKIVVVNNEATLTQFRAAWAAASVDGASDGGRPSLRRVAENVVCGIDCEWRDPRPISLVQVAFFSRAKVDSIANRVKDGEEDGGGGGGSIDGGHVVFLLDFVESEVVTATAMALAKLLASVHVTKVVFGFKQDDIRLRVTLGTAIATAAANNDSAADTDTVAITIESTLDFQNVLNKDGSFNFLNEVAAAEEEDEEGGGGGGGGGGGADARGSRGRKKKAKKKDYASQLSLKKAVQANLGLHLDKTCQRSNWDRRPLTREQLQYAAADAAVLLDLHSKWLLCC